VTESKFLADWANQAVLKEKRNTLLSALQIRLQNPLPPDLINTITECDDPEQLNSWFHEAITANSLAEFRAHAGV
jgi:hypothetical protein